MPIEGEKIRDEEQSIKILGKCTLYTLCFLIVKGSFCFLLAFTFFFYANSINIEEEISNFCSNQPYTGISNPFLLSLLFGEFDHSNSSTSTFLDISCLFECLPLNDLSLSQIDFFSLVCFSSFASFCPLHWRCFTMLRIIFGMLCGMEYGCWRFPALSFNNLSAKFSILLLYAIFYKIAWYFFCFVFPPF